MSAAEALDADALCLAARDIARHVAGLAEDISHLRHMSGGENVTLVDRQLTKLRDQVTLLSAVVSDIAKAQHT